ncbi:sensor histidine kinase [Paenibacillus antri]|uniref:histidine kinase n=1 Tax=Paenibacillus antri TaxID=2582848 RepID=A0A5R9G5I6_9BACL|nr:sensor histidine kinase [Paenibacillus antri]TLS50309.1 sensor histidine kinase [Paenibacillus antri]
MKKKYGWTLQRRIAWFTVFLVLLIIVQIGILTYYSVSRTVEKEIGSRALHIASQVAASPEVVQGFKEEDPSATIQPFVERIRILTDAEFIVVGDAEGIRYSHPIPSRIGKEMVGGDNDRALLLGESYTSKAKGSLGLSLRGKVPVRDEAGNVIGIVSVGFLLEDIRQMTIDYGKKIAWVAGAGLFVGIAGAMLLARSIKRTMFGLEPEEISSLYQIRDTVIQSIREGIMVVNKDGNIELLNETARNILSVPKGKNIIGQPVIEYVPNGQLLEVLRTGERQLDQESDLGGKTIIANRIPVKSGGEVIGVVSSFRLKSEIDQLTEELSQVQRYSEALRAQTHEYNNFLYTVSGLIQLGAYDEALELIHKESSDTQDWIQVITDRIRDPAVGGILLGFMNRSRELKVDLTLDRESSLKKLPARIRSESVVSILGNLVTNAFEAVGRNDEADRKVRIFLLDLGDDLLLEVEDSGPGIADEDMPYLFELGFTTKEAKHGKRGFGLTRVAELTKQLGGTVSVEEGEWGGARFVVAIPKEGRQGNESE